MHTRNEDALLKNLAARVKWRRIDRKWSQAELAKKCGVNRTTITNLESGRMEPSLRLLRRLAAVFETSVTTLVYVPGDPPEVLFTPDAAPAQPERKTRRRWLKLVRVELPRFEIRLRKIK